MEHIRNPGYYFSRFGGWPIRKIHNLPFYFDPRVYFGILEFMLKLLFLRLVLLSSLLSIYFTVT